MRRRFARRRDIFACGAFRAIGICLLHSYAQRRTRNAAPQKIVAEEYPDATLSLFLRGVAGISRI